MDLLCYGYYCRRAMYFITELQVELHGECFDVGVIISISNETHAAKVRRLNNINRTKEVSYNSDQ